MIADVSPPKEKRKYPRKDAIEVARELVAHLAPVCLAERLYVAGSLRRRKLEVGDVELVFVPQYFKGEPIDFFSPAPMIARTDAALDRFLADGVIAKRPNVKGSFAWGPKNKLAIHVASGIPVDLFTATEQNWFNYLVCRTGGAETNKLICSGAIARGWHWTPYDEGFKRLTGLGYEVHPCQSEEDVFAFAGVPFQKPWERK